MNIVVTVALLPALFSDPSAPDRPVVVASGAALDTTPAAASLTLDDAPAPTTTTPPTTAAPAPTTTTPPTTAAPPPKPTPKPTVRAAAAAPTTTAAPKPKPAPAPTTTSPPTTAAPKPKPRPTTSTTTPAATPASAERTESGKASWYDHQPGICAHKTLPMGTVVTVTSTANGKSTTCTVGDRGPFIDGWIIDLHPEQFEDLAPRSTGVIAVRISW